MFLRRFKASYRSLTVSLIDLYTLSVLYATTLVSQLIACVAARRMNLGRFVFRALNVPSSKCNNDDIVVSEPAVVQRLCRLPTFLQA